MNHELNNLWNKKEDISSFFISVTRRFNEFEAALTSFAHRIPELPKDSINKYSKALQCENDNLMQLNNNLSHIIEMTGEQHFSDELLNNYRVALQNALSACDGATEKLNNQKIFLVKESELSV